MGKVSLFAGLVQRKELQVLNSTILSQFGAKFKIMLLVVYEDHWLTSVFKKESSFPENEV